MGVSLRKRVFVGQVFVEAVPVVVSSQDVTPVDRLDIPPLLRTYAERSLRRISGGLWWTLGTFMGSDPEYVTAVARWTPDGVRYGIGSGV